MTKKKILNSSMVVVIFFTILCGAMAVGSVKGWFQNQDAGLVVSEKSGIVTIERQGISYELKNGDVIQSDDIIRTSGTASVNIMEGEIPRLVLNGNTEISVENDEEKFQVQVIQGEVFSDARNLDREIVFCVGNETVVTGNAVLSVSGQKGAQTIYIFAGNASITGTEDVSAEAGDVITIAENSDGITVRKDAMMLQTLNDFQIRRLKICELDRSFCFGLSDIEQVEKEREEELQKAQQAQLLQSDSETDSLTDSEKVTDSKRASNNKDSGDSNNSQKDNATNSTVAKQENETNQGNTSGDTKEEPKQEETDSSPKYCTIEIRCDTILGNMENLKPEKEGFVPSNGIILATAKIEFTDGETAFDVLERACELTGIQLEYSYTPLYESYYIEGINYIYEFDCGDQSGWMYKVNGWFPNYGCSSYKVKDGDVIVWCYTCNGLGADVGGSIY